MRSGRDRHSNSSLFFSGVEAVPGAMSEPFIQIGNFEDHKGGTPFGIVPSDLRYHCYIIGKTGSGKTTLQRNLFLQLLAHGHGAGLIDPHGDEARDLITIDHPAVADRLIYFNPGDPLFAFAFNPLSRVPEGQRALAAAGIVESFKHIWPDSWGPRMEYILQNVIASLIEANNTSLLCVNRLLTDDSYRKRILNQVTDPVVNRFWTEEFERYDPRFRREAIAPIQNKIGALLLTPAIRSVLAQVESRVCFRSIMDERKIFVANLSMGTIGAQSAGLIGSLLVSQFQLAAMGRDGQRESDRRDFTLFVDEIGNVVTQSFARILSEARKYRLSLVLSNQYFGQLQPEIRSGILGNVGTIIAFRVGFDDGEQLQGEFARDFKSSQFASLSKFQMIARLHRNGEPQVPFLGRSMTPLTFERRPTNAIMRAQHQRHYSQRSDVDLRIRRFFGEKQNVTSPRAESSLAANSTPHRTKTTRMRRFPRRRRVRTMRNAVRRLIRKMEGSRLSDDGH